MLPPWNIGRGCVSIQDVREVDRQLWWHILLETKIERDPQLIFKNISMYIHTRNLKKIFKNLSKKILETFTSVLSILASSYRKKYLSLGKWWVSWPMTSSRVEICSQSLATYFRDTLYTYRHGRVRAQVRQVCSYLWWEPSHVSQVRADSQVGAGNTVTHAHSRRA